jgi:hypothetical protein
MELKVILPKLASMNNCHKNLMIGTRENFRIGCEFDLLIDFGQMFTILLDILLLHLIRSLMISSRFASSPFPSKVVACLNFIRNLAYIDVNFLC